MTRATIIERSAWFDLFINDRLHCSFSDRQHAERVLERYTKNRVPVFTTYQRSEKSARGRQ